MYLLMSGLHIISVSVDYTVVIRTCLTEILQFKCSRNNI